MQTLCDVTEKSTIIIDAGHGGEDCGAIGVSGVYEKDLNLSIATILGELLTEKGYAVIYTRTEDALLYTEEENIHGMRKISDLKNRCKIGAEYKNSIYISIHMNSYKSSSCNGLQVYFSENNASSQNLASKIQSSVKEDLQPQNNRNIKYGKGIYLLENLTNPAVLIECGFLTNPTECENLSKKEYQKELSSAIFCGIIEYINEESRR
jgi:N-acetylmuramoyl-L-alanine amidase